MSNEIIYRKNSITNADIVTGNCLLSHAMTGETLASDTLDFRVWSDTGLGRVDADFITQDGKTITTKDGKVFRCFIREDYTKFVPGSSLEYKRDNKLVSKFFLRDVKRAGKYMYDFNCVSAIGILGDTMHYGGIYTGQTVATVAGEILEGLPYEIDPIVGDIKLYGWLPFDTKRNNLQQITIATAIAVRTKPDGSLLLTALDNIVKGEFDETRVAIGGNVTVDKPYTAVRVAEHYFQAVDDEVTLFSEVSTRTEFLKFREPMHSLTVSGGIILESGANYAVVECNNFTEVKGKKYLHTDRVITIGDIEGLPSDKIYNVNDATLITSLNSSAVAEKLYEAYTKPKTIQANVLFGDERASDVVGIVNPYSLSMESGFLKKQDINISNNLLANSDFVLNYIPTGSVSGYANRILLTENQTWAVPAGVDKIRVIICGGGDGGKAGTSGTAGQNGTRPVPEVAYKRGNGGYGGKAGKLGEGGRVLHTEEIPVTGGQTFAVVIGKGGMGGTSEGADGSLGTDTTFGPYTSQNGIKRPQGYVDVGSGMLMAEYGKAGTDAGDGKGPEDPFNGRAGDATSITGAQFYGGAAGADRTSKARAYGGGGSGATGTRNGNNGGNASGDAYDCYGGKGADGVKGKDGAHATVYGGGGEAGHGGSGGGGGGSAAGVYGSVNVAGTGGSGGAFGKGGNGKQGCIIIYY